MRNLKKVLAIALCIAIGSSFTVSASAQEKFNGKLVFRSKSITAFLHSINLLGKQQVKEISSEGIVESIVQGKDGIMVLLKTKDIDDPASGKINLCVNRSTEIISAESGKKVTTSDIKEGMLVRAYYGPAVTKSIPPQSVAKKIVVGIAGTNGTITEKTKGSDTDYILVSGTKIGTMGYDQIKLRVNDKTEIINGADNSKLSVDNLKNNLTVKAYYGPMVTKSMPPIGGAEKIVVDLLRSEGKITDVEQDNDKTVLTIESNKKLDDGTYEKMIVTVDSNTQFLGKDSKTSVQDLRVGTKVRAYYGPIMLMIYPPRVHAEFLSVI